MQIRTFQPDDTDAVISLWVNCGLTRPWNNPSLDIDRKLAVKDSLFLVAASDKQIVGSVMGGYDGHRGWINYLAVDPGTRKRGCGRALMDAVQTRLLTLGCPKINLQIRTGNDDVVAFYEAIGYTEDPCRSFGKRLIED